MKRFSHVPELNTSDVPPGKPGVFWVECLAGNETQKFLVYSPVIQGVCMHWLAKEKRTVPCFKDTSLCPGGHTVKNMKWRCYVFAFSYRRHKNVFVQLTKDAWDSWMCQVKPGQSLRGQTINVRRTEAKNGRLYVEVEQWNDSAKKSMPNNEDVRLSLFDLWRFDPSELCLDSDLYGDMPIGSKNGILT